MIFPAALPGPAEMKECTLVGHGLVADNIFSLESAGNRDGCNEPYVLLADTLNANG